MRCIDRQSLESINSPIKLIMEHIPYAIINVAPEREEEFLAEHSNLIIKFSNSNSPNASAKPIENIITFNRGLAELCWSAAYSYPILYEHVIEKSELRSSAIIEFDEPEHRKCIDLLNWAFRNSFNSQSIEWPDHLPKPYKLPEDIEKKLPEHVAQEWGLTALAFIGHHELAHITLNHSTSVSADVRISQEKDADRTAAEWILGCNGIPEMNYMKRVIGIALGLLVFMCRELYTIADPTLHPRWFDRYYDFAENYFGDEEFAHVWALALVFLKLHMDGAGIDAPARINGSLKHGVDEYLDIIARERK